MRPGMSLAELCVSWKRDTRIPMASRLTVGLCKGIFLLPCSSRPGNFLTTSLAVSVPMWHDMLLPLGSDVDMSKRLRDNLWWQIEKYSLGSIAPRPRPLSVWTIISLGSFLIKLIIWSWCGRRLWWIERNQNLGSKDFRDILRRRLSAIPFSWFSFWPNVNFRIGKRYKILAAWEYTPNV